MFKHIMFLKIIISDFLYPRCKGIVFLIKRNIFTNVTVNFPTFDISIKNRIYLLTDDTDKRQFYCSLSVTR